MCGYTATRRKLLWKPILINADQLWVTNMCEAYFLYVHSPHSLTALTGHPRRSLSHCQVSPSLLLLSPSLMVYLQMRGEAGSGDPSLQQEVPVQVPVTVLPPLDILKNKNITKKYLKFGKIHKPGRPFNTNSFRQRSIQYLFSDWLLEGGWLGVGLLLAEKKHQIGWVPKMGPMNARGRLELTGAPHWSTLQRKGALIRANNTFHNSSYYSLLRYIYTPKNHPS